MHEPTLEQIDDYHTLNGEKRRVVWAVVISCLLIGGIYASAKAIYGTVNDEAPTTQLIGQVPVR
jgi:hypothetical protein